MFRFRFALLVLLIPAALHAQKSLDPSVLLERLDKLEELNRNQADEIRRLREEIQSLRSQPTTSDTRAESQPPAAATTEERVQVAEQRIEDQAQSKVETSQKYPIRISGMALTNFYINGRNASSGYPVVASLTPGGRDTGASIRQSVLGLEFYGPQTFAGGKISGTLFMDFFAGSDNSLGHVFRIRTSSVQVDWSRTSIMVGQQKPIMSPRDPVSFAQVGVSPLTGAGNPWLWEPQIRLEQRFPFGDKAGLRAQVGIFETNEQASLLPATFAPTLEEHRPAWQGRFVFFRRGLEIAPGFHYSVSHVAGVSLPSKAVSVDWQIPLAPRLELTGMFFSGSNIANLGTLRQGFTIRALGDVIPVRSAGGWGQLEITATRRVSLHLMYGQQDDQDRDLVIGQIGKNQVWAGNVIYRLAPNVILSWESSNTRTNYVGNGLRLNNHHDLALAYLF